MPNRKKLLLPFILILAIVTAMTACSKKTGQNAEKAYDINRYSIAYYENGEWRFENHGTGTSEDSVFELASNGKVVTAYITMQLIQEGKLHLEDKIGPYLNSSLLTEDDRIEHITIKQLLCHTAGFSPSFELGIDKKLYSAPGEKFRYSGVGYIYLQSVIEHVSGMTINQAARHYVFEPLGMDNSTFGYAKTVTPYMNASSAVLYALAVFVIAFLVLLLLAALIGRMTKFQFFSFQSGMIACVALASVINIVFLLVVFVSKVLVVFLGYLLLVGLALFITRKHKKLFYACIPVLTALILVCGIMAPVSVPVTNDVTAKKPNCAYTLKSTSKDMAAFCQELMQQYDNADPTVREMFSPAIVIDSVNSWGLGIAMEAGNRGSTYWHSGINPGFQSLIVLDPSQRKCMIALTNSDRGLDFCKDKARTFLGVNGDWNIPR